MRIWWAIALIVLGTISGVSSFLDYQLASETTVLPLPPPGVRVTEYFRVERPAEFTLEAHVPVPARMAAGEQRLDCDLEVEIAREGSGIVVSDRYTVLWSTGTTNGIETYGLPENRGGNVGLGSGTYSIALTNRRESPGLQQRGGYLTFQSYDSKESFLFTQLLLVLFAFTVPSGILLLIVEQVQRQRARRSGLSS